MRVQCSACRGFRNGGGRNFQDPGADEDLILMGPGVWKIFRIQGGWPMSENDIFRGEGVQTPDDTMNNIRKF